MKALGRERGGGSAKDLETGIELRSLWAQLRYISAHYHEAIGANRDAGFWTERW